MTTVKNSWLSEVYWCHYHRSNSAFSHQCNKRTRGAGREGLGQELRARGRRAAGQGRQERGRSSAPGVAGQPAGTGRAPLAAQSRLPRGPGAPPQPAEAGPGGSAAAPARPRSAATRPSSAPGPGRSSRCAPGSEMGLEPLFQAWSYFRRRKFRECADVCSQLLERPPGEQVAGPGRGGRRRWGAAAAASRLPRHPGSPLCLLQPPEGPGAARQRGGERWAAPSSPSRRPGSAASPRPLSRSRRCGSSSDTPRGSPPGPAPALGGSSGAAGPAGELPWLLRGQALPNENFNVLRILGS